MPIAPLITRDKIWFTGLVMIVFSLFFFYFPVLFPPAPVDQMGFFLLNYVFVILYFIVLAASGRLKKGRNGLAPMFLFLILFLISAYALNKEMSIFERSTGWWSVVLVLSCLNYMGLPFFDRLPSVLQHVVCLLAGLSLVVFGYLMIYLVPVYIFGAIYSFFLGISLHCFVPLLLFIYTIVFIRRAGEENRRLFRSWWAGISLALLATIVFITRWVTIDRDITRHYKKEGVDQGLPAWVNVAQHIPRGPITEKILKTGLIYSVYNSHWGFFGDTPSRNFGEARQHDPLVILATLFTGEPVLSEQERIKVLESLYDSRHQAQERLWKGDDLCTQTVKTSIQLYPGLHLAYTEKNITVANNSIHMAGRDEEEAIYTFHLPEGAVVSSLSLRINGQEEKGKLTTREKADSAYKTIVSHERRDPSVVHWQEGNTVSVRVFPVVARESRLFTIGITAPLEKKEDELIYRNVYFDGPSPADATESVSIHSESPLSALKLPSFFQSGNDRTIQRQGKYQADWALRFREKGLDKRAFVFDGKQYALEPYYKHREPMDLRQVYLDVNKSWTREEYEKIVEWVQEMSPQPKLWVYVPKDGMVAVTNATMDGLFDKLSLEQFSLFPLFGIDGTAASLMISKSPSSSPVLADLDSGTGFSQRTQQYLSQRKKWRLFSLGSELSPYLKSLKEFRAFRYEQGELSALHELLNKKEFAADPETDDRVVIDPAGLVISRRKESVDAGTDSAKTDSAETDSTRTEDAKTEGAEPGPDLHAPDHVLRLFAYNHILQQMGGRLICDPADLINEGQTSGDRRTVHVVKDTGAGMRNDPSELISEARQAHIVSPVSSLVVLEKQEDYDRFGILDSKNSLKNASLHSKGSVPEPGEWAVLLLVVMTFLYVLWEPRRDFRNNKTRHS